MEALGYFVFYLVLLCGLLCALRSAFSDKANPSRARLPPGPTPVPVIGNLLSLGDRAHRTLADLARIHGPVMSLKLGCLTTVVVSSAEAAKEVMLTHDLNFSDRAVPDGVRNTDHQLHSIAWLPVSPYWRTLRRICKAHIFSTERLCEKQDVRRQKVDELLEHVRECSGLHLPVDIGQMAFSATLNLLSNTIFSVDLADPNSETARDFKKLVNDLISTVAKPNLSDFFPVLRRMDIQGIRRRLAGYTARMGKMVDRFIDDRLLARKKSEYLPHDDVLDVLLDICEENKDDIDRTGMQHLLMDLFGAGTETTSISVEWAMAELIHNPSILSKVREEMDRVVGKGNPVQESDIVCLPYLQAVVKETFRMHPPTPFMLPRRAREDKEVAGFTIPRGAQVLVNAFAIGRDPESWEDPNSFRPERFIGSDIDLKGRNFELIPFGAGRRICPGYPLALRMIPLMVASLVHGFDWKPEGGVPPEDMNMEDLFGLSLRKAIPLRAIPIPVLKQNHPTRQR